MENVDLLARHDKLPKGFKRHTGGPRPFEDGELVELMIETAEGLGSSDVVPAEDHSTDAWNWRKSGMKFGRVVGYRATGRRLPRSMSELLAPEYRR